MPGYRRKPKLLWRTAWKLCHKVNTKPRIVLKGIAKRLETMGISVRTHIIQHCLNRNGLYEKQSWWTSLHKLYHIVAWFNFDKIFLEKENYLWEQILWSDKRKIEIFGHTDIKKIWFKKCKTFLPKNTVPTLKHGGNSMMFWGCFSWRETGKLIAIRRIMKSEDYIKILA